MQSRILLVFEPSVGHSEIVVWVNTNGQLTWNWIPRVLMHLPNGRVTIGHLRHFVVSSCGPKHFDLFAFRVGNDLSADVGLICLVEYVDPHIDHHIGEVNLFDWVHAELLDTKTLTTGESGHTAHQLVDIR